ncbi:MAG: AAA family ATPase, partial [Pseudomonadales bacterium]
EIVTGPIGQVYGHKVDLRGLSVADENIFHNYDDQTAASIEFKLSNKNRLKLYFAEVGSCVLIPELDNGRICSTPSMFRAQYNCRIGFVPILGPVDHHEQLYEKEAARLALFNYGAARNFRNIWHHFPDKFEEFRRAVQATWPGMDIEPPETEMVDGKARLFMYCPEDRRAREICWAGFGFQVWCQMLTHIIQSEDVSIFLIDEPDIYLHSDLQRQLISLLRQLDADILIATHSTEILSEAEFREIVIVNKSRNSASRVKNADQLSGVFQTLGSNLNPVLTQIAKTKKVVFVEGHDFQILGKFAEKCGFASLAARRDFAVVQTKGFNPQKVKNLVEGISTALGFTPKSACIFDRDFRTQKECDHVATELKDTCDLFHVLERKEIENYLLVPSAIEKAARKRIEDKIRRGAKKASFTCDIEATLDQYSKDTKSYVAGQYAAVREQFERDVRSGIHKATISQEVFQYIEEEWNERYLELVPGKGALSHLNETLREIDGISITPFGIIQSISGNEVPADLKLLFQELDDFASSS